MGLALVDAVKVIESARLLLIIYPDHPFEVHEWEIRLAAFIVA